MATANAKKEIQNLNNSVLVDIIAKKSKNKNIFANVISKNKPLMLQVINKLDKNTLGKIIGKDRMINIVVDDKNMLEEARTRKLTPNQLREREEAKELRYKKNVKRRQALNALSKSTENEYHNGTM
jgi:hypothetical protein